MSDDELWYPELHVGSYAFSHHPWDLLPEEQEQLVAEFRAAQARRVPLGFVLRPDQRKDST